MSRRKATQVALNEMIKGAAQSVVCPKEKKDSLLSKEVSKKIKQHLSKNGRTIQSIPLSLICLGENVRKSYDDEELKKLALSLSKDGLIQFPTLCMKQVGAHHKLICRNGHRRVLAAKKLGWDKIECIILPFSSVRDELYHSLNANLREDVFYLDIADAYKDAASLGESDAEISERIGVNKRTVGWYRRIAEMNEKCRLIVRTHPDVFNATWAIKLARKGPLPKSVHLESHMNLILNGKRDNKESVHSGVADQRLASVQTLRRSFKGKNGADHLKWAKRFLEGLASSGLITERNLRKIEKEIFTEMISSH